MKIVINKCYGGFGLSDKAVELYFRLKGWTYTKSDEKLFGTSTYRVNGDYFSSSDIPREDPDLVHVVETLAEKANDSFSQLEIVDLPAGTLYRINEYDGYESIETSTDIDWKVAT